MSQELLVQHLRAHSKALTALSLLPRSGACRRRAPLFLALGGGGPSTISSRYQFARALEQRLHATALMMMRRESRRRRRRRSLRLGRLGV